MAAPGSLYGEGAQLLEGSAQTQTDTAKLEQAKTDTTVEAGKASGAQLGETERQISSQQATMALEKMKASDKMQGKVVTITPQIALGMAKNTGDPSWMQAIGQDMRSDVLMSLYTHGIKLDQAKKAPKITQVYDANGKIRHAVVYTDEQGNIQQLILDAGITPENLNKGKGGKGGRGGAGKDPEEMSFKEKKAFIDMYQKRRAEYSDPMRSEDIKKRNPEKYNQDQQWLKDNLDTNDQILKSMGQGGAAAPSSGGTATPEAPFDADAFIEDALGQ